MNRSAYRKSSIWIHWLSALIVVLLFISHEGETGSFLLNFHISGGAILGIFLLWRVFHRIRYGFTNKPNQRSYLNALSRFVLVSLLCVIVLLTITGYLLPWSLGNDLEIYAISIPSPMVASPYVHSWTDQLHSGGGHLLIVLVLLHVLGAAKHFFINKDKILQRMIKSSSDGV